MALVLDGTNGVSGVDGTASNPSLEGTDSNTGVFFPAADTVAIGTGGTERVRVSSAGVFGVNTTSPAAIGANYGTIDIRGSSGGGFNLGTTGTLTGQIYGNAGGITYDAQGALTHFWYTNATERARITSGGDVVVTSDGGALGYGSGSGGTVTQATSKSTAVTLNKPSGTITMSNAALSAGASVSFQVLNNKVSQTDTIVVNMVDDLGSTYTTTVWGVWDGYFYIRLTNVMGSSASEAVRINFTVINGSRA